MAALEPIQLVLADQAVQAAAVEPLVEVQQLNLLNQEIQAHTDLEIQVGLSVQVLVQNQAAAAVVQVQLAKTALREMLVMVVMVELILFQAHLFTMQVAAAVEFMQF